MNAEEKLVTIDDLWVGREATHCASVDGPMVEAYAKMTGDFNPVHVDAAYAATTMFGRPIAHGLLVAGFLQTALTSLVAPGGVSTNYSFQLLRPVPVGSEVMAKVKCSSVDRERRRASFEVQVSVMGGDVAVEGTAEIAFPRSTKTKRREE